MIPSGYKEDTVYSAVPTDGSGDLSFTRASNGTRINSAGLVEDCPWNLLEQSETFDTASWPKLECSITANSTNSPIGTLTADSLIESNTNSRHMIYRAFTSVVGQSYSLSVYCKQSTRRYANINLKTSSTASPRFSALFDLQTGLNVSTSAVGSPTGTSFDIVSFPNGWYRISISMNATSTSTEYEISTSNSATPSLAEGTPAYLGDGTSGIYIWGAQLNIGSTAKPYFPTTDRLNVPRLTYQNGGGGCPSLLLEKQSTNLITYSEQLDQWSTARVTVTANNTTSPDGTQNAEKLECNLTTTGGAYIGRGTGTQATGYYTISTFAKKGNNGFVAVLLYDVGGSEYGGALANLNDSTIALISGGNYPNQSCAIENVGNDWFRISYTCNKTNGSYLLNAELYAAASSGNYLSVTAGQFNYLWGAQVEASSYKTSYIPTTSASATRVADACFKTGISSLIGQSQGTFFVDANIINPESPNGNIHILMVGTTGERITIYTSSSGTTINTDGLGSGGGYVPISGALTLGRNKIAVAYANNDIAFYVNGNLIGTRTTATIPSSMSQVDVGGNYTYPDYIGSNTYNEVVFFKTRLSNSELQSLTTL